MNLLHSWLHDYGLAILALTTIIKLTLWPIQNKANRSIAADGCALAKNAGAARKIQR